MADIRSFSNIVMGSDAFAELSFEAQALYMHLCMNADDNGCIATPGRIRKGIGASAEAMSELQCSGYIAMTEDGACVIVHWSAHNAGECKDGDNRKKKVNCERVRRYRARQKEQEEASFEASCTETCTADVTACNADVTVCNALQSVTCNANVTLEALQSVTNSPLSCPPLVPLLSSPQTPYLITPYNPPNFSPSKSSSSLFSARAQEFAVRFWNRKLKKHEKDELRSLSLGLAAKREETEAGEVHLSDDDVELLGIAFNASAEAGACSLAYIRGVYANWHTKGIHSSDDYWTQEVDRDIASGKLRIGLSAQKGATA